ncbi:hypothetical protein KIN20_000934 [Parelaphostrongylus tenuis]|uniref:Uncharacterized protein n=1 Tax=Parelaphostrongylus tenuis TaxID=148309 RepID=A0AAD5LX40_PARTN|nr:hypothetical protein KIN20_000934 [Parelaphostrongylus tenuis]
MCMKDEREFHDSSQVVQRVVERVAAHNREFGLIHAVNQAMAPLMKLLVYTVHPLTVLRHRNRSTLIRKLWLIKLLD